MFSWRNGKTTFGKQTKRKQAKVREEENKPIEMETTRAIEITHTHKHGRRSMSYIVTRETAGSYDRFHPRVSVLFTWLFLDRELLPMVGGSPISLLPGSSCFFSKARGQNSFSFHRKRTINSWGVFTTGCGQIKDCIIKRGDFQAFIIKFRRKLHSAWGETPPGASRTSIICCQGNVGFNFHLPSKFSPF